MDRDECRIYRDKMQKALDSLSTKTVKYTVGSCSYDAHTATFKVEVATSTNGGAIINKAASEFLSMAHLYGLKKTDLGKVVTVNGQEYKIDGLNTRKRRFPVKAIRQGDNHPFNLTIESVLRSLGRSGTTVWPA